MNPTPVNQIKASLLLLVMTLSSLAPAAGLMTKWSTDENIKTADLLTDSTGTAAQLPFFQKGRELHASGVTLITAVLCVVVTTLLQAGVNGFVGDATTKALPRSFGKKLKNALTSAFSRDQLRQVGLWSLVKSIKKDPTRADLTTLGQRLSAWVRNNKTFILLSAAQLAGACVLAKVEHDRHTAWNEKTAARNELLKIKTALGMTDAATLADLMTADEEWTKLGELKDRGVNAATLAERRNQKDVLNGLSADAARQLGLDFAKVTVQEILDARTADAELRPQAKHLGYTATATLPELKAAKARRDEQLKERTPVTGIHREAEDVTTRGRTPKKDDAPQRAGARASSAPRAQQRHPHPQPAATAVPPVPPHAEPTVAPQVTAILADATKYPHEAEVEIDGTRRWVVRPINKPAYLSETQPLPPLPPSPEPGATATETPSKSPVTVQGDAPMDYTTPLKPVAFGTPASIASSGRSLPDSSPLGSPQPVWIKPAPESKEIENLGNFEVLNKLPTGKAIGTYCVVCSDGIQNILYFKQKKGPNGWVIIHPKQWAWSENSF